MAGWGARRQAVNLPMSKIAKRLGTALRAEVTDKTGLTGNYDLQLDFDPGLNLAPPPVQYSLRHSKKPCDHWARFTEAEGGVAGKRHRHNEQNPKRKLALK
jgi:uncharacterized protein (TIGR03435 family)